MVFQEIGKPSSKESVQEEEMIASREEKLNDNKDQALTAHTKGKRKSHFHPHKTQGFKRPKRDLSNFECFTCEKLGHISINFPMKEEGLKNTRIF